MSEQNKRLVPKKRFPDFENDQEWKLTEFSRLYDFQSTNSYSRDMLNYENGSVKNIHYGDIHTKFQTLFDIRKESVPFVNPSESLTKIKAESYCVEGDMIFADASEDLADVGKSIEIVNLNKELLLSGLHTLLARQKDNKLVLGFGGHLFKSAGIRKQIQKESQGAKVLGISGGRLSGIKVYYPSDKAEQQKIADCLSLLDDLITAKNQKVEALKQHKKSLMQQLFPAEGETVPKLRFPEFENSDEWQLTTIGKVGSFYYGKSAPKWSLEERAQTPCVRYGELYTKFGAEITQTYSRTNIDPSNLRFSKGGEVLVPRVGEKPEDFGKCCCYLPLKNIAIGEMISVFETDQNPLFYTYYFRNLYRQFAKVVEGQNVKNLYYVELEPLPICKPPLAEQQRIAHCLSSIDDLISTQIVKLEALKEHKRGLMQKLFPLLDEA